MPSRKYQTWSELFGKRSDMLDTYIYNRGYTMVNLAWRTHYVSQQTFKKWVKVAQFSKWQRFPMVNKEPALAYWSPNLRVMEIRVANLPKRNVVYAEITSAYVADYCSYVAETGDSMPIAFQPSELVDRPGDMYQWFCEVWSNSSDPLDPRHFVQVPSFSGETHREPHQDENGMINGRFL